MKTNFVLALLASSTLLVACGGFSSSVGPGHLNPIQKVLPTPAPTPNPTEIALVQLDGSKYSAIQNPTDLPGITSLSLKLSGKQAPFQYEITMTPKDMPERSLSGDLVAVDFTGDKKVVSIMSQTVVVTILENGNCVSIQVPNQNQSVFFRDVPTLDAAIELCK